MRGTFSRGGNQRASVIVQVVSKNEEKADEEDGRDRDVVEVREGKKEIDDIDSESHQEAEMNEGHRAQIASRPD